MEKVTLTSNIRKRLKSSKDWNTEAVEPRRAHSLMMIERKTKLGCTVQRVSSEWKDAATPWQQLPNLVGLMHLKWCVLV